MKTILLLTLLIVFGFSGLAIAQCNTDPNEIGIFWSEDCGSCQTCLNQTSGTATAYVILINATTSAGVSGYNFCLTNADGSAFSPPPTVEVHHYILPPHAVNVFDPPCFEVAFNTPIPWSACITLLSIEMQIFDSAQWCFGVKPNPAVPAGMVFVDGADPNNLLAMHPNTGPDAEDFAMACLNNPDCPPNPVSTEESAWGSLKSLFR